MNRIFKNKKANITPLTVFITVLFLFFASAFVFSQAAEVVEEDATTYNAQAFADEVVQNRGDGITSAPTFFGTLWRLLVWDFGDQLSLPLAIDLIYKIMTIIMTVSMLLMLIHGN